MIYIGKINKQEFADAVALTFISLQINLDPFFLLIASPIIINNTVRYGGLSGPCGETFSSSATMLIFLKTVI